MQGYSMQGYSSVHKISFTYSNFQLITMKNKKQNLKFWIWYTITIRKNNFDTKVNFYTADQN